MRVLIAVVVALLIGSMCPISSAGQDTVVEQYNTAHAEFHRLCDQKQYDEAVHLMEELEANECAMANEHIHVNVVAHLASGYALVGEKEKAILYLRELMECGCLFPDTLKGSEEFDTLREEPAFKELESELERQREFWENPALNTPYKENISEEERIAGLSKFWSEVKYNFAYFDRVPEVDWDALYIEYLPKVRSTKSTKEYYLVLAELCARLKDGHTAIEFPKELGASMFSRPPINTRLIEGRVVITEVLDEKFCGEEVRPGMEIIEVDGVPVHKYAQEGVIPYQPASTKQQLFLRSYGIFLLAGPRDQHVEVKLRDKDGKVSLCTLPRTGWKTNIDPLDFRVLDGNIAYTSPIHFMSNTIAELFDSVFPTIETTDALIIDLRRNGGGNDNVGYHILGCLTDKPFKTHQSKTRKLVSYRRARGSVNQWQYLGDDPQFQPNGSKLYTRPVVVLTSAHTGSAAEGFCVAFDTMKRGVMVGEPTLGSTGQPLKVGLPGGGKAWICTCRSTYPDGKEFVGTGISPHILVRPTVEDVQAGRDTVLEAALKYLKKQISE